jgi:hypothetical protein
MSPGWYPHLIFALLLWTALCPVSAAQVGLSPSLQDGVTWMPCPAAVYSDYTTFQGCGGQPKPNLGNYVPPSAWSAWWVRALKNAPHFTWLFVQVCGTSSVTCIRCTIDVVISQTAPSSLVLILCALACYCLTFFCFLTFGLTITYYYQWLHRPIARLRVNDDGERERVTAPH